MDSVHMAGGVSSGIAAKHRHLLCRPGPRWLSTLWLMHGRSMARPRAALIRVAMDHLSPVSTNVLDAPIAFWMSTRDRCVLGVFIRRLFGFFDGGVLWRHLRQAHKVTAKFKLRTGIFDVNAELTEIEAKVFTLMVI